MTGEELEGTSALNAPFVVRAAAAVQAVGGVYLLLSAVQLLTSIVFYGDAAPMQYANWVLGALGAIQAYLAIRVYRMQIPMVIASAVLAGVLCISVIAWVVLCIRFEIYSCMQLGSVLLEVTTVALLPFAIGPSQRASKARKALEDAGLDLGI